MAFFLDNFLFAVCHLALPILALIEYDSSSAGDYELLQLWLTVPSMLLMAVPPVVLMLIIVIIILEVFCGHKFKCTGRWRAFLESIWPMICMCYSVVWLPAVQVITFLERPPSDQQGSFAALIPYTLVLTALLVVQAVFVLFHPTFRAIFRVVLRKSLKL